MVIVSRTVADNRVDELESRRIKAIEEVVNGLHVLKHDLLHGKVACSFECSSIHLGALMRGMIELGIPEPLEHDPFPGKGLKTAMEIIRGMRSPRWCANGRSRHPDSCSFHHCSLRTFFDPFLKNLEKSINQEEPTDILSLPNGILDALMASAET